MWNSLTVTFPWLFMALLPMPHLPTPQLQSVFLHFTHAILTLLQVLTVQNDVDYQHFLLANLPWLHIKCLGISHVTVKSQLPNHAYTVTVFPDKIIPWHSPDKRPIPWHFSDNCKIPWHFQVYQKSGHPVQSDKSFICRGCLNRVTSAGGTSTTLVPVQIWS